MMDAAERHRELVARLAAQGPRLHEPKMMRVGRLATTEEAGLLGDIAKVRFVAIAAGGGDRPRGFFGGGWLIIARGRARARRFVSPLPRTVKRATPNRRARGVRT